MLFCILCRIFLFICIFDGAGVLPTNPSIPGISPPPLTKMGYPPFTSQPALFSLQYTRSFFFQLWVKCTQFLLYCRVGWGVYKNLCWIICTGAVMCSKFLFSKTLLPVLKTFFFTTDHKNLPYNSLIYFWILKGLIVVESPTYRYLIVKSFISIILLLLNGTS